MNSLDFRLKHGALSDGVRKHRTTSRDILPLAMLILDFVKHTPTMRFDDGDRVFGRLDSAFAVHHLRLRLRVLGFVLARHAPIVLGTLPATLLLVKELSERLVVCFDVGVHVLAVFRLRLRSITAQVGVRFHTDIII